MLFILSLPFYFIYSFSLLAHLGFRPAVLRAPLPHGGRVLGPAVVSEQREDEGWEEGPRFAAGGGGGGYAAVQANYGHAAAVLVTLYSTRQSTWKFICHRRRKEGSK